MATLERIRQRIGLLAAIIVGLALLSFILGDFLTSGNALFQDQRTKVAEIDGKNISIMHFQDLLDKAVENVKRNKRISSLDQETIDQVREQVWDQMIRDYIMEEEYSHLGLAVSEEEAFDMVQGNNIHPYILQVPIFQNKQGQFDRTLVLQFLKNMENDQSGEARSVWIEFEKSLIKDRLNTKYNELIKKGFYVTQAEARTEVNDRNTKVTVEYISKPFENIPDSLVKTNDDDLAAYLKEHAREYEQVASRDIAYVTFDVIPSEDDFNAANEWIKTRNAEFSKTNEMAEYVNLNSDNPFDDKFYKKGELSKVVDSVMFANPKVGLTYGPWFENETFKVARCVAVQMRPDSVKARHILLSPENKLTSEQIKTLSDSIINALKKGADFGMLARKYSADKGSAEKGGDLGWFKEGMMVKPFNDTCFIAKTGVYKTAESQYGLHIIQVTERGKESKKIQVAVLERKVEPSTRTYQYIYQKAVQFAGSNNTLALFNKAIDEQKLNRKVATNMHENDRTITGLEQPRELIRWAFNAKKGQVTEKPYEFGNKFVIAAVTEIKEKGTPDIEQIRNDLTIMVRRDKKAGIVMKELNELYRKETDLSKIAEEAKLTVNTSQPFHFAMMSVPGVGYEPLFIGTATGLPKDKISNPVKGNTAAYILKVTVISEPGEDANVMKELDFLKRSLLSKANNMTYSALQEVSDVQDFRSRFF